MKRAFGRLLGVFLAAAMVLAANAAAAEPPYVLVDVDTGEVLAQRQAGDLWYPASLTKLMTIYVAFQGLRAGRIQMDSPVVISERATQVQPATMGFPAETVVTVDNALKMLVVKSANDVANAVAEAIGGSIESFVNMMNAEAARLGLSGTRFVNPHGLPSSGQSTNARDMAMLAYMIWHQFPEYRSYFAIEAIRYGSTVMPAGNALLGYYAGANGMKTGYICSSGYNLVATATRNGRTLLAVVLGEASEGARAIFAAELLDVGFAGGAVGNVALPLFRPNPTTAGVTDLRSTMCPEGGAGGDNLLDLDAVLAAQIGPRQTEAVPVEVVTGGANPNALVLVDIPLPRPRPSPYPADYLGVTNPVAMTALPFPRPRP